MKQIIQQLNLFSDFFRHLFASIFYMMVWSVSQNRQNARKTLNFAWCVSFVCVSCAQLPIFIESTSPYGSCSVQEKRMQVSCCNKLNFWQINFSWKLLCCHFLGHLQQFLCVLLLGLVLSFHSRFLLF